YNWRGLILPQLEQTNLYYQIDAGMAAVGVGQSNMANPVPVAPTAWKTAFQALSAQTFGIPVYQCPSDSESSRKDLVYNTGWNLVTGGPAAGANYWVCAGPEAEFSQCGLCVAPCVCYNQNAGFNGSDTAVGGVGVFSLKATRIKIGTLTDGTSSTLLLGEEK